KVFAEAGPSISKIANSRSTTHSTASSGTSSTTSSMSTVTGQGGTLAGITTGAGIDLSFFHLHLRPEFRFNHWFSPNAIPAIGVLVYSGSFLNSAPISPTFRTNANEGSFLLGLTFYLKKMRTSDSARPIIWSGPLLTLHFDRHEHPRLAPAERARGSRAPSAWIVQRS